MTIFINTKKWFAEKFNSFKEFCRSKPFLFMGTTGTIALSSHALMHYSSASGIWAISLGAIHLLSATALLACLLFNLNNITSSFLEGKEEPA